MIETGAALTGAAQARPRARPRSGTIHRYLRALGTYPRRWHFYLCFGLLLNYAAVLPGRHQVGSWETIRWPTVVLALFMSTVVAAMSLVLVEHLKEQLGDWRARLYPRFRAPHLLLGAAVQALVIVLVPLWSADRFGISFVPLLMVSATVAATISWAAYYPGTWLPLVVAAGWLLVFPDLANSGIFSPALIRVLSVTVILIDWLALAVMFWRLATLHEDRREYARAMPSWRLRAVMTGDPANRVFGS